MQFAAVIVGTRHTFQVGGEDCPREHAEALGEFLINACRNWNLHGIAEEMSSEGLFNYKAIKSVPFSVATALGLPYRACDPTLTQRALAGIVGSGEILIDAKMQGLDDDEAEQRLAVEEMKREGYWLRELQDQNVWPTLFVCGAIHVNRFKLLLDSTGFPAHVLVEDWGPETIGVVDGIHAKVR